MNRYLLAIALIIGIGCRLVGQTPCNSLQQLSTNQLLQLSQLKPSLDSALWFERYTDIDSISQVAKNIYGSQGGYPEAVESYYPLTNNTTWMDLPNAINLSRVLIAQDSAVYSKLWRLAKGQSPQQGYAPHSIYLRYSAEVALGLLKIAGKETDVNRKTAYTNWAMMALDSLATMQLPNGAFPFPDLRPYNDPVFSPIIQAFLNACGADSVNVLVNGWIIDDKASGEFKFDAGVIADAYYQAYVYTNKLAYKNIAIAIGNYLKPLKLNTNYNYNTFVSLGLTRAFQLTEDTAYLNRAITNLRFGVFPGQLPNGRWVDGHNAKSVYHAIILKNAAVTLPHIPTTNPHYDALKLMLINGLNNYVNYYQTCNYSGTYYWAMRCYPLHASLLTPSLKTALADVIGKHINQSALNGKYLDVATMGDYLELISTVSAVKEHQPERAIINLFPNPVSALLSIQVDGLSGYSVSVRNQLGQIVYAANGESTIDMTSLPSGLYVITITTGQQHWTQKIIKQ